MININNIKQIFSSNEFKEKIRKNLLWSLSGTLAVRIIGLASSIVIARILGQASYGELGIIQSTIAMFFSFAGFGMGATSTRYVAQYKNTDPKKAGNIIALTVLITITAGTLCTFAMASSASWIASNMLGDPQLSTSLQIGSILLLINAFNGGQSGILNGFEAFKQISKVNIVTGIISIPILTILSWRFGITGTIIGLIAVALTSSAVNYNIIKTLIREHNIIFNLKDGLVENKIIKSYSIPSVVSGMLVMPTTWYCNSILVNGKNGLIEMSIFNVANQWRTVTLFLPACIGGVVGPLLSKLHAEKKYSNAKSYNTLNILTNTIIGTAISLLIALLSPVLLMAYGSEYSIGNTAFILLSISCIPLIASSSMTQSISSTGNMWVIVKLDIFWSLLIIALSHLLIPDYGATGLAGSYLLSYMLFLCAVIYYLNKSKKFI